MDCANIQRHLSEYVDGVLDAQTRDILENHLSSCKECQKELELLKDLIQDVGNLEMLKAPDDFLDQLHRRMEARFNLWNFLRNIFRPFQIKIPLQLVTAAVMAVLIFTVVFSPHTQKELSFTRMKRIHESVGDQAEKPLRTSESVEIKAEASPASEARPEMDLEQDLKNKQIQETSTPVLERSELTSKGKIQPELQKTMPSPVHLPASTDHISLLPGSAGTQRIDLVLLLKRTGMEKTGTGSYDIDSQQAFSQPEKSGSETLMVSGIKKAGDGDQREKRSRDYSKDETIQDRGIESDISGGTQGTWILSPYEARKQIETLIAKVKGHVLAVENKKGTDTPVSIDAQIPAKKYIHFYKEIQQLGTLQSPMPSLSAQGTEPVIIRIRFVDN